MSSQAHQTATQTASPTQEQNGSPSPGHAQGGGNQRAIEAAGLDSSGTETDTSLLGPFAEMMLSVMPLSTALPMALPFVHNPVVRDWIRGLAPDAIAGLLNSHDGLAKRLLDALWPAGVGFEISGFGDLGLTLGAGFQASHSILNTNGVMLDEALDASLTATLDTAAGGQLTDAFGNGPQMGADAAVALGVQVSARALVPCPTQWWTVFDKTPTEILLAFCNGEHLPTQLQTGVAPGEAFEVAVVASGGPEGSARAAMVGQEALPDWLGTALEPLLDGEGEVGKAPDLSRVQLALDAHLGAAGKLQTGARLGPTGLDWGVQLHGTLSGMAAGGLGTVLQPDEDAALQAAARKEAGGALVATVRGGVHLGGASPTQGQEQVAQLALTLGSVELATTGSWGAVEHSETKFYPSFSALLATQAGLAAVQDQDGRPGQTSLSEVLASGATLACTRATRVALDPAQLPDVAPGIWGTVLDQLGLDHTRVGPTATDAELALEGTVEVTHEILQAAADAGVVAPGPTAGNALEETVKALCAAATGEALPRWATHWTDALAALGPTLWTQSQVTGWAGAGVGGAVALGEGIKGSASGGMTARVHVEIPTTPEQHQQLADATR